MKILKYILSIILILVLLFLGFYTGKYGHSYKFVYNFGLSFFMVFFFLKKKKIVLLWSYIVLGISAMLLPFYLFVGFYFFRLHVPSSLALVLGMAFGYLYYKTRYRLVTILLAMAINVFMLFYGYDLWLNKLNFNTFFGRVEYVFNNEHHLYKPDGSIFEFEPDKTYVLDFWNTSCAICFKEFPKFEKIRQQFQNKNICFYAANYVQPKEDPENNERLLRIRDIDIPVLFFKDNREQLFNTFKVEAFPTIIAIRNDTIIYRGSNLTLSGFLKDM